MFLYPQEIFLRISYNCDFKNYPILKKLSIIFDHEFSRQNSTPTLFHVNF